MRPSTRHRGIPTLATILAAVLVALVLAGCGSGGGEDECKADQVEVTYLGTANDRTECQAIPGVCGGTAACDVQACIAAMYDLCQSPAFGVACSDTFAPTIISCNE